MNGSTGQDKVFDEHVCDSCGSTNVTSHTQEHNFQYGSERDAVVLSVRVPVWTCSECGLSYTDETAERIRHEAICAHLGRLAPRQLVAIRKAHGMSQEQFADLTSIGIASIKRWESYNQIPNASLDKLVRLLVDPENVARLRGPLDHPAPKFRTALGDSKKREAAQFQLRVNRATKVHG